MKKWEVVGSSVVHKNKYFSVIAEKFHLSNGDLGKYYIVKSLDFVSVIATENGFVYFIEMYRYILKKRMLEIPMGSLEEDETPLEAAKRELREETGIIARRFKKIGYLDASKGRTDQHYTVFIAQGLSFGEQELDNMESDGDTKVIKLKISEVSSLIRKGKITDSHTIASFQLFMLNCKG